MLINLIHALLNCETLIFKFLTAIPPLKAPINHANDKRQHIYERGACVMLKPAQSSNKGQHGSATSRDSNIMWLEGSSSRDNTPPQSHPGTVQCPLCGATVDMDMEAFDLPSADYIPT